MKCRKKQLVIDPEFTVYREQPGVFLVRQGPVKFHKDYDYLGRQLCNYPSWLIYILAALTIISGVYAAMAFKWHTKYKVPACLECEPTVFAGALLQTQLMFFSEALGFVVWYIDDSESRKRQRVPLFEFVTDEIELRRRATHWYWWPTAAVQDCVATILFNLALTYTYVSVVQMLRNFLVCGSAIMQMLMVRKAVKVYEWIGIVLITFSLVLTAIPAFLTPDQTEHHSGGGAALGVIFAIVATCLNSVQLLWEEWILRRGRYHPLKAIGMEGFGGLIITLIMWGPYQVLGVENVTQSWYQQAHSGILSVISVTYIPAGFIFNMAGLGTTKLGGGVLRGVCFVARSVIIWIVSLIVKWQSFDYWNLASMLLFIVSFTIYLNKVPYLKTKSWFKKPVHFCCTDPALDYVQPGHQADEKNLIQFSLSNEELGSTLEAA